MEDSRNKKVSASEDLARLMKLAEELKEKTDRRDESILRMLMLQVATMFFGISSIIFVVLSYDYNEYKKVIFTIVFSIISYTGIVEFLIFTRRKKSRPDRAALEEVVEVLRETESSMAKREEWTALERAEFRIRLSRFDIPESHRRSPSGLPS